MGERLKDMNWTFQKQLGGGYSDAHATMALLMDIRAELKQLNAVFACANFQAVPKRLAEISIGTTTIAKNTRKARYKQCPRCLENAFSKGECRVCGKKVRK